MKFIADLHIHSPYSRGTSRNSTLSELFRWARIKGIGVLGTGDFTHPRWMAALEKELSGDDSGLFSLKKEPTEQVFEGVTPAEIPVRFMLQAEISSIYKKNGKTRKVHSLIFAPGLAQAKRISARLGAIGNIVSDGRPILGLDPKNLLEIILEVSPDCHLIPAHIWTPWFSVFGSKSGFDTLEECFEELLPHIFALETGLSSDPLMNNRLSMLDRYTLISNSDSHSAQRIGREANMFDTGLSYREIFEALKTGHGFAGTIEFFPEEGKYHCDGHRKCNVVLDPVETRKNSGLCPVCGKELTIGVLYRVCELADRAPSEFAPVNRPFRYAIPLHEICAEICGTGVASKNVQALYAKSIRAAGSEDALLSQLPVEEIMKIDPLLGLGIGRLRENKVVRKPGYDGEYGIIRVFEDGEADRLRGQNELFSHAPAQEGKKAAKSPELFRAPAKKKNDAPREVDLATLNPGQAEIAGFYDRPVAVIAGPGTGKTRTLVAWLAGLVNSGRAKPEQILAVTFTNRAASQLASRLEIMLGSRAREITVQTFHSLAFQIITTWYPNVKSIYDASGRTSVIRYLYPENSAAANRVLVQKIEAYLDGTLDPVEPETEAAALKYQAVLESIRSIDVAALCSEANLIFESRREVLDYYKNKYTAVAVDEFQDINRTQYKFLAHLAAPSILVIGDPDQAIYGFRGSDPALFRQFVSDYGAREIMLSANYRSSGTICAAGGDVIGKNKTASKMVLGPVRQAGPLVSVLQAPDEYKEAEQIAKTIRTLVGGTDLIESGGLYSEAGNDSPYSFGDIAVLTRTHRAAGQIIESFAEHGIPVSVRRASSPFEEPPYSVIADVFRFLANRQDIVAYRNIVARLIPELDKTQLDALFVALGESGGLVEHITQHRKVQETLSEGERGRVETLHRFLEFIEAEVESQGVYKGLFLILEKLHERMEADLEAKLLEEMLLETARMHGTNLAGFIRSLFLEPHETAGMPHAERVSVLTFHAAKGLEFPVVFLAAAEEGITPQAKTDTDLEEERRLFYVAMTRAKDRLFISHAASRDLFGRTVAAQASRFIEEIRTELRTTFHMPRRRKKYNQPSLF